MLGALAATKSFHLLPDIIIIVDHHSDPTICSWEHLRLVEVEGSSCVSWFCNFS